MSGTTEQQQVKGEAVWRKLYLKLDTTLQKDACKSGLGAALMREGHPVAYTSCALTTTE